MISMTSGRPRDWPRVPPAPRLQGQSLSTTVSVLAGESGASTSRQVAGAWNAKKTHTNTPVRSKTSLGVKAVFTLGLSLLWSRNTPRCAWYTHYCGSCGLRLLFCDEAGRRNYVESSQLSGGGGGGAGKTAPSPHPASSLTVKDVPAVEARYRHLRPTGAFSVQFGSQPGVPSSIKGRARGTGGTYTVEFPDLDWQGKFNVDFLIPNRINKAKFVKTVWSPRRASIRISSSSPSGADRVAGLVQLSQTRWDIQLYFPKETATTTVPPAPPEYESRMIGAHDESLFDPDLPYVLWKSSKGHLLWTSRRARDGTASGTAIEKRMILVDSYDRLVAMEVGCGPRSTRGKYIQRTDPPPEFPSPQTLYVYGNLPRPLVDEIVTSYVAVRAQTFRKAHKDHQLLMETQ